MNGSYGYTGASWASEADRRRAGAQLRSKMYGQYAPQQRQYRLGRSQLGSQQYMNASGERDKMWAFGVNALSGLMR